MQNQQRFTYPFFMPETLESQAFSNCNWFRPFCMHLCRTLSEAFPHLIRGDKGKIWRCFTSWLPYRSWKQIRSYRHDRPVPARPWRASPLIVVYMEKNGTYIAMTGQLSMEEIHSIIDSLVVDESTWFSVETWLNRGNSNMPYRYGKYTHKLLLVCIFTLLLLLTSPLAAVIICLSKHTHTMEIVCAFTAIPIRRIKMLYTYNDCIKEYP